VKLQLKVEFEPRRELDLRHVHDDSILLVRWKWLELIPFRIKRASNYVTLYRKPVMGCSWNLTSLSLCLYRNWVAVAKFAARDTAELVAKCWSLGRCATGEFPRKFLTGYLWDLNHK
jgi:hypothetical protein